jgi:spore coat protein JC
MKNIHLLGLIAHGHGKVNRKEINMWIYEKKLEYPVSIKNKDLKLARYLLAQYGGPTGELSAALQYLNQRYTMPDDKGKALLTDIGTEELNQ